MKNVGSLDAQVRWVLGIGSFLWSFFLGSWPHWLLLALGLLLVSTAYLRFCPLWFGLRVTTHRPRGS